MQKVTPRKLVQAAESLYSPPAVYHAVMDLIQNPGASAEDISAAICQDPVIAARLIRLANSPLFAVSSPLETVTEAVMRVGTKNVGDLVQTTVIVSRFRGLPQKVLRIEDFWRHSIAVGLGTQLLAKARDKGMGERFFLMGLMHDLGRLVLLHQLPEKMAEIIRVSPKSCKPLYQLEKEEIGFDHTDVGRALFELWKLPQGLAECMANHHKWVTITDHPFECAAVHIADALVHALELGSSGELCVPPINGGAWDILDMEESELPVIANELQAKFLDTVSVLLPSDSPNDSHAAPSKKSKS